MEATIEVPAAAITDETVVVSSKEDHLAEPQEDMAPPPKDGDGKEREKGEKHDRKRKGKEETRLTEDGKVDWQFYRERSIARKKEVEEKRAAKKEEKKKEREEKKKEREPKKERGKERKPKEERGKETLKQQKKDKKKAEKKEMQFHKKGIAVPITTTAAARMYEAGVHAAFKEMGLV